MDRWNIITALNYLKNSEEEKIIRSKIPDLDNKDGREIIKSMVATADLTWCFKMERNFYSHLIQELLQKTI